MQLSSTSVPWMALIIAGFLEIGWAIGLKYTGGFTRLVPSVLTISAIVGSIYLLGIAADSLPIGTAYAVWVGIGSLGTAVLGIILFGESASLPRLICLGLLIISIIGLKLTASSPS